MQPYFFPYLGYFQLINAVDKFIIYDDVQFIKGGWINRNRIINHNGIQFVRVEMDGASSNKNINQIELSSSNKWRGKLSKTIEQSYSKSMFYESTIRVINEILFNDTHSLSKYLYNSITSICKELNITTKIIESSTIYKNSNLNGQDRVIDICKKVNATKYINPIGGLNLYESEIFKEYGVKLEYLSMNENCVDSTYSQYHLNLSIIDLMMKNSKTELSSLLNNFKII